MNLREAYPHHIRLDAEAGKSLRIAAAISGEHMAKIASAIIKAGLDAYIMQQGASPTSPSLAHTEQKPQGQSDH